MSCSVISIDKFNNNHLLVLVFEHPLPMIQGILWLKQMSFWVRNLRDRFLKSFNKATEFWWRKSIFFFVKKKCEIYSQNYHILLDCLFRCSSMKMWIQSQLIPNSRWTQYKIANWIFNENLQFGWQLQMCVVCFSVQTRRLVTYSDSLFPK